MPVVHFPDAGGNTITLKQYGDENYLIPPPFSEEVAENIPNVTLSEEDVLICSYPKAGTHWLWEMTSMLRAGSTKLENLEKGNYILEKLSQSTLTQMPPGKTIYTHLRFNQLPVNVRDGKVKIVFIYRNPKDTAVSFYNFASKVPAYEYTGQFNDFLTGLFFHGRLAYGDYFAYMKDWDQALTGRPHLPIYVLSYEELLADTFCKAEELTKFLKCPVDDDIIREIVEACSFSQMSSRYGHQEGEMPDPSVVSRSQLVRSMVCRKGKVGDWKDWFTVAQSERMDEMISQKLKGSKFEFQFSL